MGEDEQVYEDGVSATESLLNDLKTEAASLLKPTPFFGEYDRPIQGRGAYVLYALTFVPLGLWMTVMSEARATSKIVV